MHPAQRRAILAILALIEQGIAQLKSILIAEDDGSPVVKSPDSVHREREVLSDKEDDDLEARMEHARLQMMEADERAAEQLFRSGNTKTFEGRDPLPLMLQDEE